VRTLVQYAQSRSNVRAQSPAVNNGAGFNSCFPAAHQLLFLNRPALSVTILLLGRILLGVGENFIITGALSWGLAMSGTLNTGKVMSWVGTSLYAAFAIGAPAGTTLYAVNGFTAIALAATLIPLVTLLLVAPLRDVALLLTARPSFSKVLSAVWLPGIGLAISGVGFGAVTTFVVLLFAQHGWGQAWLAITLLSIAFIVSIRGLRILGIPVVESPKAGQIRRLYAISRLRSDLEDLEMDVASASFRVGYEDPSYFSRDYKKLFGTPPLRDIARLRSNLEH
jgi:AraC-like DNA-binding protein